MGVIVTKDIECICDACGARAPGRSFLGIVLSPPAGWFVHGRIAFDELFTNNVEQWLYCSEKCAAKISDTTEALVEIADRVNNREC